MTYYTKQPTAKPAQNVPYALLEMICMNMYVGV